MIYLRYISGPRKGRTRNVTNFDPEILLYNLVDHGFWWEIDYSDATEEEIDNWSPVDIGCRVGRAVASGRPVYFLGRIFVVEDESKVLEVVDGVIDAISWCACDLFVDRDDGCGLFISIQSLN
jgi:hypothetical protein